MLKSQRVAELVTRVTGDRPLLGEGVRPVLAVPETSEAGDVLHHTEVLVVSLFDEEAVVLDSGLAASGCGGILLRQGSSTKQEDREGEAEPSAVAGHG